MAKISTNRKMSFEEFKKTFGPVLDMAEGAKKDQFLVAEYKRNMKEVAEAEERVAKEKLEVENLIRDVEETYKVRGSDEEQE